jgi:hypothetical protein
VIGSADHAYLAVADQARVCFSGELGPCDHKYISSW